MQQSSISARNIGCMIALMSLSSLLMIGMGTIDQDIWLAVIAATVFAVPLILVYTRIATINPGLNLFEMADKHFGKAVGYITAVLFSFYATHVSALVTRNFSEFVSTIALERTPKMFIIIGMIAVAGYLASTSFKVMGKWSLIAIIIVSLTLVLTFILSLPTMNFNILKPIMEHSVKEILSTGFSFGSIAFADIVLVLIVVGSLEKGEKPSKAYAIGILWAFLLIISIVLRNILVLGHKMISISVFPSYIATRVINAGTFIEHIESIVAFNLIFMGITKVAICIRTASMGVAKLLHLERTQKRFIAPICLLSIAICVISFSNMQELIAFAEAYRFYAIPFTILIPVIIWIKSEISKKRKIS